MKREFNLILAVLMLSLSSVSFAQKEKFSFSLKDAKEYAKENSYVLKNSKADIEFAKKKVWETTAAGLPQVNAEFVYTQMFKVPEASAAFSGLGSMMNGFDSRIWALENPGMTKPDKFKTKEPAISDSDLKWGATMDLKVTQLIFSGAYLVGLQASRTYENLTEYLDKKNIDDVLEEVENSYVLVLIAKENKTILESTLKNLNSTLLEITEMHKEGFVEDTEVDQLQLTVKTVENTLAMLTRQVILAERLFKFQLGIDMLDEVEFTENLDDLIISANLATMSNMSFDVNSNINYKLVENKKNLSHLNLKLSKTDFLPTIAAFYNHNENFNNKAFNMTPADVVGVSLSLPIFSSGQRYAKVKQARIEYDKAETDQIKASQGLMLDYEQTKTNYLTSLDTYKNYKINVKLSEKIFNKTAIKYKEGISSSLDLTQTQNQYLQTQANYFKTVLELFKNKSKLDKLIKKY
ncbi:MAG: TolC family protein [Marinifilaceae bacterium]